MVQGSAAIAGLAVACGDNRRPNSRLGVGVIGVGGHGTGHLGELLKRSQVQVIAVADVDATHVEAAIAMRNGLVGYRDYRDLLARPDIDAVVIATPDHWHVKASIDAANAGKHIYCEKPLTLRIAEGRTLVDVVQARGVAFQTGSQQRSFWQFQKACELVRNGGIGQLMSIETVIPEGPFHEAVSAEPQPDTLDWDMWLGQCAVVPYHQLRAGSTFRFFRDHGGGNITDIGAHELHIAQWGAGYDRSGPTKVRGTATYRPGNAFESPIRFDVTFTYDNGVTLRLGNTDSTWLVQFNGSDGWVKVHWDGLEASRPEILDYEPGSGAVVLKTTQDHYDNWFDAIENGTPTIADVEAGHRSATICHLANIAIDLGRELTWDPVAEQFPGDAEANARRSRPQRAPWNV